MRRSLQVSLAAVFAALHVVLYLFSVGLWRNWAIYIEPIEGIVLGPFFGFLSAIIGSSVARTVKPDSLWLFGIVAEPISVLTAGFLAKAMWKPAFAAYATMLLAYFVHPYGRALPLWTILDILLALALIYPAARLSGNLFRSDIKRQAASLALLSFVCIATDSLVRMFLLVPCGLYALFFESYQALYAGFVGAAISSYIEDAIVVFVSLLAGAPAIVILLKTGLLKQPSENQKDGNS
jgi:hypothetical protein